MYSEIQDTQYLNNDQYFGNWGNCPLELMVLFFSHLDLRSLATCMFVNKFWLEASKYYLQHYNLWRQMVETTISNKGTLYREKCTLQWREILLNFFLWRKVWKARVSHYQSFHIKHVRAMKVYKNKLIVVLDEQVKYLNLRNTECHKTLDVKCYAYEESDFLVTILMQGNNKKCNQSLCIQNKRYALDIQYCDIFCLDTIGCYKLYSNCCYFIDNTRMLWVAIAEPHNYFCLKAVAKFYGPSSIIALHVFESKVYIVTKEGNMYFVDGLQFRKIDNIFVPLHCPTDDNSILYSLSIPFLFNDGYAAYKIPADKTMQMYKSLQFDKVIMAVPGLSALLEHGELLILGYENGKVEIHSIYKIRRCFNEPKKQFHMRDFVYDKDGNYHVQALDVYEQEGRHYLVVAIENNIHQLSIKLTR